MDGIGEERGGGERGDGGDRPPGTGRRRSRRHRRRREEMGRGGLGFVGRRNWAREKERGEGWV